MPKSKLAELIASATADELRELGITPAAQAVALQERHEEMRPKRKKSTVRKVKKVFDASIAHPPAGFRWIYNRLTSPFEHQFDGMVYAFDSNEYRLVTLDVARFLWAHSIISYDPVSGKGLRALALDPFSPDQLEPNEADGFGEKLVDPKNAELIDRSVDPNPAGKIAGGGVKTRPAVVSVTHPVGTNLPRP